jgi:threonine synthase
VSGFHLRCVECGREVAEGPQILVCPNCAAGQEPGGPTRGVLQVEQDTPVTRWPDASSWDSVSQADFLAVFLPVPSAAFFPPISVGATPLLEVPGLRSARGLPRLWVKDDTRNPSGSTKDRASFLVVAKAREYGIKTIATASTGNAATALAAVAASAGVRAVVFVPATTPEAKLIQMLAYGAEVLPVAGSYDDAFELCRAACTEFGWYNRNTALNPYTIEGKKMVAVEIAAAMAPEAPDVVVVPTGDGVILAGIAKGFSDLVRGGLLERVPRLIAVQPEGSAAIANAWASGAEEITPVRDAASVADSLVVQSPRNATLCLRRIRESGGGAVTVPDRSIVAAISELARVSGVFAEPAAAASLAGLEAAQEQGLVQADDRVVLLVTGTGLKDIPAATRAVQRPDPIDPDLEAVRAVVLSAVR